MTAISYKTPRYRTHAVALLLSLSVMAGVSTAAQANNYYSDYIHLANHANNYHQYEKHRPKQHNKHYNKHHNKRYNKHRYNHYNTGAAHTLYPRHDDHEWNTGHRRHRNQDWYEFASIRTKKSHRRDKQILIPSGTRHIKLVGDRRNTDILYAWVSYSDGSLQRLSGLQGTLYFGQTLAAPIRLRRHSNTRATLHLVFRPHNKGHRSNISVHAA